MRVDETPAGDAPGRKCPRAEQNRQRPIDVSEVTGNVRPVLPAGGSPLAGVVNPAGPDGPVVAGGPVGPCEMPSPYSMRRPNRFRYRLTRLVSLLLLGRCPHLTVTLLAQLARMLQEALLAQVIVCKFCYHSNNWFWTMLTQPDSMPCLSMLWLKISWMVDLWRVLRVRKCWSIRLGF